MGESHGDRLQGAILIADVGSMNSSDASRQRLLHETNLYRPSVSNQIAYVRDLLNRQTPSFLESTSQFWQPVESFHDAAVKKQQKGNNTDQTTPPLSENPFLNPYQKTKVLDQWGLSPFESMPPSGPGQVDVTAGNTTSLYRQVFGRSIFDYGPHNNQAIEAIDATLDKALADRGLEKDAPLTLINVDCHSDIQASQICPKKEYRVQVPSRSLDGPKANIGEWVGDVLNNHTNINKFIWVVPDDFVAHSEYKNYFFQDHRKSCQHRAAKNLADAASQGKLLLADGRSVQFLKVPLSKLPDLSKENIILGSDLDFFANTGFDTCQKAKVEWQGQKGFDHYVEALANGGVKPLVHFACLSPNYADKRDIPELLKFVANISDASANKSDAVWSYHLNIPYRGLDATRFTVGYSGIETLRDDNSGKLLWNMFTSDAQTQQLDGRLHLDRPNQELDSVIQKSAALYGSEKAAETAIRAMDAVDGKADKVVDFRNITNKYEEIMQKDNDQSAIVDSIDG